MTNVTQISDYMFKKPEAVKVDVVKVKLDITAMETARQLLVAQIMELAAKGETLGNLVEQITENLHKKYEELDKCEVVA